MLYKLTLGFCLMTVALSESNWRQSNNEESIYNKRSTVITSPNGVYIGTGNTFGSGRGRNSNSYYDDTGYKNNVRESGYGSGSTSGNGYYAGQAANYDSVNNYNNGRGSNYDSGHRYNSGREYNNQYGRGSGTNNDYGYQRPVYSVQPASTSGITIGNRNTLSGKIHAY